MTENSVVEIAHTALLSPRHPGYRHSTLVPIVRIFIRNSREAGRILWKTEGKYSQIRAAEKKLSVR